jgi:hypothetical protein
LAFASLAAASRASPSSAHSATRTAETHSNCIISIADSQFDPVSIKLIACHLLVDEAGPEAGGGPAKRVVRQERGRLGNASSMYSTMTSDSQTILFFLSFLRDFSILLIRFLDIFSAKTQAISDVKISVLAPNSAALFIKELSDLLVSLEAARPRYGTWRAIGS